LFKLNEATLPILIRTNDEKNVTEKRDKKKLADSLKNLVRTKAKKTSRGFADYSDPLKIMASNKDM